MQGPRVPSCKNCLEFCVRFSCWLLLVFSFARVSHAEPSSRPPQRTLEVLLVGSVSDDATFGERVASWFDAAQFRVVVQRVPALEAKRVLEPSPASALTIWVSIDDDVAKLYFAAPATRSGDEPRFLLRSLSLTSGLDEMGAERAAEVVHLSALALLEGEQVSARAELERSLSGENKPKRVTNLDGRADPDFSREPQESRPKLEASATSIEFGIGYGVSFHSDEGVWHGPRASGELGVGSALGLSLSAQVALPANHDLGELELRLQALQLSLSAGFRRALSAGLLVEVMAGPGLDIVDYRPQRSDLAEVELGTGATEARPNLMAGFRLALGQSIVRVSLMAELALSLSKTHYDLTVGDGERVLARPSPFAQRFGVEARF